jgi:23S rRNA pseudouridine955/2504/2580 synthase
VSGVQALVVGDDDDGIRLDRWFKRRFPTLTHGRLEKLLRTGQVRVDGARAKSSQRLERGQSVRIPPLSQGTDKGPKAPAKVSDKDAAFIKSLVIHRDDDMIVLNKPSGLAVQGGSKTTRHIDGMLDALRFGHAERPRLVHRLDRDTSGLLLLARNAKAATRLGRMFQDGEIEKTYWAVVHGTPRLPRGTVDAALIKTGGKGYEKMAWDDKEGRDAVTDYDTVTQAAPRFAWLRLMPRTGRTHQLRVHCALMENPIVGDIKYGAPAKIGGGDLAGLDGRLMLHARRVIVPRAGQKPLILDAPLPDHMAKLFAALGFEARDAGA